MVPENVIAPFPDDGATQLADTSDFEAELTCVTMLLELQPSCMTAVSRTFSAGT